MIFEISEINPSDAGKFAEVIRSPNSDTVDLSDAIRSAIHAKFHMVRNCQNIADFLLSMVGRVAAAIPRRTSPVDPVFCAPALLPTELGGEFTRQSDRTATESSGTSGASPLHGGPGGVKFESSRSQQRRRISKRASRGRMSTLPPRHDA